MKLLKILGITILVLAAIIVVGGSFLPKTYSVSRSIVIHAERRTIYNNIANFNEFLKWNPWSKMEPNAKTKITGPVGKPEHLYEWQGKETGSGYMKIKSVKPDKMVDIELKFIEPFESLADTKFEIFTNGNSHKVTWTMSGDQNLMSKWMCVFVSMDKMIGTDFEDGLNYLKDKSEGGR